MKQAYRIRIFRLERLFSRPVFLSLIAAVFVWQAAACAPGASGRSSSGPFVTSPLTVEVARSFKPLSLNDIIILPLQKDPAVAGGISANSADVPYDRLSDELVQSFAMRTSLELKNNSQAERSKSAIQSIAASPLTLASAKKAAENAGAQGALYGMIRRYDSLEGSKYGSDHPAAVAFQLWLVDARAGQAVWTASFSDYEQPLSDNLFRAPSVLKQGVGYKSSIEIARHGFSLAAQALESLRKLPEQKTQAPVAQ